MPIFTLPEMSEREWSDWMRQFKRTVCLKRQLLKLAEVCEVLKLTEDEVLRMGRLVGQRGLWIFVFGGIGNLKAVEWSLDGMDVEPPLDVRVYPREVWYEVRRRALR